MLRQGHDGQKQKLYFNRRLARMRNPKRPEFDTVCGILFH